MSEQTYKFKVEMTCNGCKNAVNKVLTSHANEISSYEIDLDQKLVTITSALSIDEVETIIKASGKKTDRIVT